MDKTRERLQVLLEALDQRDSETRRDRAAVELDQQAVGRLSRMDALQNQAMAEAQKHQRHKERLRLRAALNRIDEGEYGYCIDCGEAMEPKRLQLDPALALCAACTRDRRG